MTPDFHKSMAVFASMMLGLILIAACSPQAPVVQPIRIEGGERLFQKKNIEEFGLVGTKKIALTIDDGPYPDVTPRLLNLLAKLKIRATFFIVGEQARSHPEIVARIRDEGHIVANHSYSHANLQLGIYKQNPQMLLDEVMATHQVIAPFMSPAHRMYFRAPYAAWQEANAKPLNRIKTLRNYIGPVRWDIGTRVTFSDEGKIRTGADWDCWSKKLSPRDCAQGYFNEIKAKQGGVVLMHDLKPESAAMAELLLPALVKRGFRFVTLDDVRDLEKYQYRMY